jgi:tetratricopeptide (TPR) repeat protein
MVGDINVGTHSNMPRLTNTRIITGLASHHLLRTLPWAVIAWAWLFVLATTGVLVVLDLPTVVAALALGGLAGAIAAHVTVRALTDPSDEELRAAKREYEQVLEHESVGSVHAFRQTRVALRYAEELRTAGRIRDARDVLEREIRSGNPQRRAAGATSLARLLEWLGDYEEAEAVLRIARAEATDAEDGPEPRFR